MKLSRCYYRTPSRHWTSKLHSCDVISVCRHRNSIQI